MNEMQKEMAFIPTNNIKNMNIKDNLLIIFPSFAPISAMRTVTMILVIFLAQCTYLYADPKLKIGNWNSCIHGVKSIGVFLYNSNKNIAINESCDNIDSSQPVVILVHGFLSSANESKILVLASNLVKRNYTVFGINWPEAACTKDMKFVNIFGYPWAVKNTHKIGHLLAIFIDFLIKQCSVLIENIILIGHSLGAHICGFAAKEVAKNNNEKKIPLIIAADPANPLFSNKKCKARLCKSDAKHVKVLHTSLTFGMWEPVGDCDFFFHDGKMQPGCDILKIGTCSHSRSVEYLIDITKDIHCGFPAVPKTNSPSYPSSDTKDCVIVNYSIIFERNNPIKGNYSVFVKAKSPHCTHETFKCSNDSRSLNSKR